MDSETLAERDGWLYVKWTSSHYTEPKLIHTYWPLKLRFVDIAHRFRSTEEAKAAIGYKMRALSNSAFEGPLGLVYRLPDGGSTKPEFTEVEDVPAPKQRGKQFPAKWRDGVWYKQTSRGWVRA